MARAPKTAASGLAKAAVLYACRARRWHRLGKGRLMRSYGLRVTVVVLLAALVLAAWGQHRDDGSVHLVILHVNDTHGCLEPFAQADGKRVGGAARLATMIRQVRSENPGRVLLLHAGDILSKGGPLTIWYAGDADFRAMNLMGFDALTPGNGDFYFGLGNLQRVAKLASFPFLHGNIAYRDTGQRPFAPYVIKEVAGVRVGLLGVGRVRADHPSARALNYRDPVAIAKGLASEVAPKVDLLVALTHIGLDNDQRLAAEAPEIDLIVGGDSHSQVEVPIRVTREGAAGETVIAQAGDTGRFLGRLDVYADKRGPKYRVEKIEGRLEPVSESIPEEPQIAKLLARYRAPLDRPLFTSQVTLASPEAGPNPMGEFVAEAMRAETGADVALLDRGGVQSGITLGTGTLADVCRIHPWRNRVLVVAVTGGQLREAVALPDILLAGCTFRRNGSTVVDLTVRGRPVAADRTYAVAVGDYLFWTTPSLNALPWRDSGQRVDTLLARFLKRRLSPLLPQGEMNHGHPEPR